MNEGVIMGKVSSGARIVTVTNQKGGVGKSTLTFHIAKAAAEAGKRVLVLDFDTQGNISQFLMGDLDIRKNLSGGADYIFGQGAVPKDAPIATEHENIWLLHGHEGLDQWDNDPDAEDRVMSPDLRQVLRALPYDVVVVDTPTSPGIRHLAPLLWSDKLVIPMEPEQAAVAGFQSVLEAVEHAQALNPGLQWVGVLNRMLRARRDHQEIEDFVRGKYGSKIAPTLTARAAVSSAMQEAPAQAVWHARNADKALRELWLNLCTDLAK